ncbi:MAG: hypothetical protein ACI396_10330 [Acutalibacteraceae bacterium]
MKRITSIAFILCLVLSYSLTTFAQNISGSGEAVIAAKVPGSHIITVDAEGAQVFCNGVSGDCFIVERLSSPRVLIRADSGREVTQVLLDGDDITGEVKGGYYTFEPVYKDMTLTVLTAEIPETQGKTYKVQGTVIRGGKPVNNVTIELRSTLKSDVTDNSGRFDFEEVSCGKHSLTALENGKIVGYIEFELIEGETVGFKLLDNDTYSVTVDSSKIGVNITLELSEDGVISIEKIDGISGGGVTTTTTQSSSTAASSVDDTTVADYPKSPQTGDNANPLIWIAALFAAGVILTANSVYSRHKRKN